MSKTDCNFQNMKRCQRFHTEQTTDYRHEESKSQKFFFSIPPPSFHLPRSITPSLSQLHQRILKFLDLQESRIYTKYTYSSFVFLLCTESEILILFMSGYEQKVKVNTISVLFETFPLNMLTFDLHVLYYIDNITFVWNRNENPLKFSMLFDISVYLFVLCNVSLIYLSNYACE